MTHDDIAKINAAHDQLELLEHQNRFVESDAFFAANRAAFDFDRNGSYIGTVSNENGWTA